MVRERIDRSRETWHNAIIKYGDDDPVAHREIDDLLLGNGELAVEQVFEHDPRTPLPAEFEAAVEAIVIADGTRPSFLIADGLVDLTSTAPGEWGANLEAQTTTLRAAIASVGRVDSPAYASGHVGSAFLVADDVVLTNRHVLQAIGHAGNDEWVLDPDASVHFGDRPSQNTTPRRAIASVLFSAPDPIQRDRIDHRLLDLVLLRLAPADPPEDAMPLRIWSDDAWVQDDQPVYVVGFPGNPLNQYLFSVLRRSFKGQFGVKRLAPGFVTAPKTRVADWTVAYDASTLGGSSGSTVLLADNVGAAAAIHYGGQAQVENWGHALARTLDAIDTYSKQPLRVVLEKSGVSFADHSTQVP